MNPQIIVFIIVAAVYILIYGLLFFDKSQVHVISYETRRLSQEIEKIQEEYPKHRVILHKISDLIDLGHRYPELLIIRKTCGKDCKVIPIGNVGYLIDKFPIDFFDLEGVKK